jgi:hypothetical protein
VEAAKHRQYCVAVIRFYQEIVRLPEREAAALIRGTLSAK